MLNFFPDFGAHLGTEFPDGYSRSVDDCDRQSVPRLPELGTRVYAEDEFRISPVFAINMGLRYEMETPPAEVNGLTDPKMPLQQGLSPRFGFAWNPGRGRLTVRAGYGISFSSIFPVTYQTTRFNPPNVQVLEINTPSLAEAIA